MAGGIAREIEAHESKAWAACVEAAAAADLLFCQGPLAELIAQGAREAGMAEVYYEENKETLSALLKEKARPGDVIWMKASRGMKFEEITELLTMED